MKKKDLLLDVDEVICFSGYLEAVNDFLNTNYNIDDFDCYYIDEKVIPKERFKEFNEYVSKRNLYDYTSFLPGAIETIKKLMNAETVQMPVYDYVHSRRSDKVTIVNPVDVIIFEGILTLYDPRINELASIKIFVDPPDHERFIRRLLRDKNERGRNDDNVISQWRNVVRPMFKTFIAPQKANADIVIPWYRMNTIAIHAINGAIQELIKSNKI